MHCLKKSSLATLVVLNLFTVVHAQFTTLQDLPNTNFTCAGKVIGGYYADVQTGCQMFHVCTLGENEEIRDIKFLCLAGTVFEQETRVCERTDEVDCQSSEQFYHLNDELYGPGIISPSAIIPEEMSKSSSTLLAPSVILVASPQSSEDDLESHDTDSYDLDLSHEYDDDDTQYDLSYEDELDFPPPFVVTRTSSSTSVSSSTQVRIETPMSKITLDSQGPSPSMPAPHLRPSLLRLAQKSEVPLDFEDVPRLPATPRYKRLPPDLPNTRHTSRIPRHSLLNNEDVSPSRWNSTNIFNDEPTTTRLSDAITATASTITATASTITATDQQLAENSFTCEGKILGGLYADVQTNCAVFHICTLGVEGSTIDNKFRCGPGTLFDQVSRTCRSATTSARHCASAQSFYYLNDPRHNPGYIEELCRAGLFWRPKMADPYAKCTRYIECLKSDVWTPFSRSCKSGQRFSSELEMCVAQEKVDCPKETKKALNLMRVLSAQFVHEVTMGAEKSGSGEVQPDLKSPAITGNAKISKKSTGLFRQKRDVTTFVPEPTSPELISPPPTSALQSDNKKINELLDIADAKAKTDAPVSASKHVVPTESDGKETLIAEAEDLVSLTQGISTAMNIISDQKSASTVTESTIPTETTATTSLPSTGTVTQTAEVTSDIPTTITESTSGTSITETQTTVASTVVTITPTTPVLRLSTETVLSPVEKVENVTEAQSLWNPNLTRDNLPETNFTCKNKVLERFYPDPEANCQVFHYCSPGFTNDQVLDLKFLCSGKTMFDSTTQKCEDIAQVICRADMLENTTISAGNITEPTQHPVSSASEHMTKATIEKAEETAPKITADSASTVATTDTEVAIMLTNEKMEKVSTINEEALVTTETSTVVAKTDEVESLVQFTTESELVTDDRTPRDDLVRENGSSPSETEGTTASLATNEPTIVENGNSDGTTTPFFDKITNTEIIPQETTHTDTTPVTATSVSVSVSKKSDDKLPMVEEKSTP